MDKIHTKLTKYSIITIPSKPCRFTETEWNLNYHQRQRTCQDIQQTSDQLINESKRIIDEINEQTTEAKREIDHNLNDKIGTLEFNTKEIKTQRRAVQEEIENLDTCLQRLNTALKSIEENALKISRQCFILRENRLGIDLCHDHIENELMKEQDIINGCQKLLQRVVEQVMEQIRRLKSNQYFIDRDLENKDNVIEIDQHNRLLNEKSLNLSIYHGFTPLNRATITNEEWEMFTQANIDVSAKEINNSRQLRSYIDTIFKQIVEDLIKQYHIVNITFKQRINETNAVKTKMELQHNEITRQIKNMSDNIDNLKKCIAEKEGFMALNHTRLGNRAQRNEIEFCKDLVEINLTNEVKNLRERVNKLQQILYQSESQLRYLLSTQIQLEEDINIKINTIKIDEVDCMTLRLGMDYHNF